MKVLFAASEAVPFVKTGGLADIAGSLPPALAALGHDVRVVLPRYRCVDPAQLKLKEAARCFVPLGSWQERCEILQGRLDRNVTVYFVNKDVYFDRPECYQTRQGDYPDNAERFTFFSRAVLELCTAVGFKPDIIHANDWQTGLVSFFLKNYYGGNPRFEGTRSVFTVHNLAYQGLFWHWDMKFIGDAWHHYKPEGLEFWNRISFLKAGLVYSDIITTVSKTYSSEIQTPEYGAGLEGVLAKRAPDLAGIVNGIDYEVWNPATDGSIAKPFTAARPAGKAACKQDLLRITQMSGDDDAPLIGMVTRLVDQKGLDILEEALPSIMSLGARLVVLGSGDERHERLMKTAAATYPGQMRVMLRYDELLARKIYAGSDLFLMPSRYEPCGLSQLIALRYGTIPVVRKTGGLADTIRNYTRTGRGTGFVFEEYSAGALAESVNRAVDIYRDRRKRLALVRSCMQQDFSWDRSAKEYLKVYRKAMRKK